MSTSIVRPAASQATNGAGLLRQRLNDQLKTLETIGLNDCARVKQDTRDTRARRWAMFSDFFTRIIGGIDPERIWIDLCENQPAAKAKCQLFLQHYVQSSTELKSSLDVDGSGHESRSVNAASTVALLWKDLIGHANDVVLRKKRAEDPENAWRWTIKYSDVKQGKLCGPVNQITNWISETLAPEMDLTHHQQFVKREATSDDVLLVLSTLWKRSSDIKITPCTRVAFHGALLLAAIGGFRMSVVAEVAYRQVELALVRVNGTARLVATITLQQNKRQELTIRKSQDEYISLSVTFVPCKTLCLLSVLIAQALIDDAFEVHFPSFETLASRPRLKANVDYMHLKWKEDILDQPILPITYNQYWKTWTDTMHAAGLREKIRPYATRVGAGGRLDAVLSSAVRDYIMSNTQKTFERNYVPRQIRVDLLELSFGEAGTGPDSQMLFSLLRQACLRRDGDAPVELSQQEAAALEAREDVQETRALLADARAKHGRNGAVTRRLSSRLSYLLRKYTAEGIREKRQAYFANTDKLGALGQPVDVYPENGDTPVSRARRFHSDMGGLGTNLVSKFIHEGELGGDRRAAYFVEILCEYLAHRFTNMEIIMSKVIADVAGQAPAPISPPRASFNEFRCLFGCPALSNRTALTNHVESHHGSAFTTPFECPECWRLGAVPVVLIRDARQYCLHTQRAHGRLCSPIFREKTGGLLLKSRTPKKYQKNPSVSCLLCQGEYRAGQGHSRHFDKRHRRADFEEPFLCPACQRSGVKDVAIIDGVDCWLSHTEAVHNIDGQRGHDVSAGMMKRQPVQGYTAPEDHLADQSG